MGNLINTSYVAQGLDVVTRVKRVNACTMKQTSTGNKTSHCKQCVEVLAQVIIIQHTCRKGGRGSSIYMHVHVPYLLE